MTFIKYQWVICWFFLDYKGDEESDEGKRID